MRSDIGVKWGVQNEVRRTTPASFRYAAALVSAMLVSSLPLPVLPQGVQLVVVDVHTVAEGYRTSKLIGSNVVNDQNEKIGTIEDIIIGRSRALLSTKPAARSCCRGRRRKPLRSYRSSNTPAEAAVWVPLMPVRATIWDRLGVR
jgi:hypothetical protein